MCVTLCGDNVCSVDKKKPNGCFSRPFNTYSLHTSQEYIPNVSGKNSIYTIRTEEEQNTLKNQTLS